MKSLVQGRRALSLMVLGGCLGQFNTVSAAPMDVTATIDAVCELAAAMTPVTFGVLTPGGGADGATTGSVEWRCTTGTDATIAIDSGGNGNRTMDNTDPLSTATLAYELYQDAGYSQVWSNSGLGLVGVTGTGISGVSYDSETVYGLIAEAAIDAAEVGSYSDQVDVVINVVP